MTSSSKSTTRRSTSTRKSTSTSRTRSTATSETAEKDVILGTDEEVLQPEAVVSADAEDIPAKATRDEPVAVEEIPVVPQPELKKKELVDAAVERSGIKKKDAKPAIEAALAVLGEALSEGRELNLIPFGKLKVTRMKKGGNGQIINARVRQPDDDQISLSDPLAQAAE